ncbi:YybH family protein [Mycobacterium sp. C31M]
MTTTYDAAKSTGPKEEVERIAEIERILIEARSTEEAIPYFTDDHVRFTFITPTQFVGIEAVRDYFDQQFGSIKDIESKFITPPVITVDGNLAFSYCLQQYDWTNPDGSLWACVQRVSDTLRKEGGEWKVFHTHVSSPMNPATGQIEMSLVE